jgi:putative endonuclease
MQLCLRWQSAEVLRFAQDDKASCGNQSSSVTDSDTEDVQHSRESTTMRPPKTYFVYIMSNRSKTLYTGVTNSLIRRVREHKLGTGSRFAAKYKLDRLVYFERFEDIVNVIEREKRIKGWLRIKKIALIVSVNPAWRDLSLGWCERHQFQPEIATSQLIRKQIP